MLGCSLVKVHLLRVQVSVLHEELEKARERIAQLEGENGGSHPGTYVDGVSLAMPLVVVVGYLQLIL